MGYIKITIEKATGEVKVEGMDYRGDECIHPLDAISELLGEVEEIEPKVEDLVRIYRWTKIKQEG